jgi:putative membrane protein
MWLSAIVAALHYLALAIGLPAVFLRGRALRGPLDRAGVDRALAADTAWGIAAILWVATGLLRAFGGLEKGSAFYLQSRLFYLKMALFVAILALEVRPIVAFTRWRRARGRGARVDTAQAPVLARLNHAQLALAILMVFVASAVARGLW